jgi:hypothetical protein
MSKIPIKYAIESACWLTCVTQNDTLSFMIKIRSFESVNLNDIDNIQEVDPQFNLTAGDLWLLKLDVVNLCKQQIPYYNKMLGNIILIDSDDFEFKMINDDHLRCTSQFATKSGLNTFYCCDFIPKITYSGTILFFLPKDDMAEYFISIDNGDICER